jgi:hypothetical protein
MTESTLDRKRPRSIRPADFPATRSALINEAEESHRRYPQYVNHWDTWGLARITNTVKTKLGTAFAPNDVVLIKPAEPGKIVPDAYATAYSFRNGIDTAIPRGSFVVLCMPHVVRMTISGQHVAAEVGVLTLPDALRTAAEWIAIAERTHGVELRASSYLAPHLLLDLVSASAPGQLRVHVTVSK